MSNSLRLPGNAVLHRQISGTEYLIPKREADAIVHGEPVAPWLNDASLRVGAGTESGRVDVDACQQYRGG
jgi:hypothetical protein